MFSIIEIFGTIALISSFIGLLPQIYKLYKTKSAKDLSMLMLINYCLGSLAWIVYGSQTDANFVTYANIVGLITSLLSIGQKLYYDKKITEKI